MTLLLNKDLQLNKKIHLLNVWGFYNLITVASERTCKVIDSNK